MKADLRRNGYMLKGKLKKKGYDWWWHNVVGINRNTGERSSFFIQYMILNPDLSPSKAVLGQLPENKVKGNMPSYALMRVGVWGRNKKHILKFYPSEVFEASQAYMKVKLAGNTAWETGLKGHVHVTEEEADNQKEYNADSGEMSWDLKAHKQISYSVGYGASHFLRNLNAFAMYWHVQGMKVKYNGIITLDGEKFDVFPESSYGYQDKNWGRDYTNPWVWIGCNNFTSEKTGTNLDATSLDVGGGAPVVFGRKIKGGLLIAFYHNEELFEYNFSKFWTGGKQDFSYVETENEISWHISAENKRSKIIIDFSCNKNEMIRIDPEGADGKRNHSDLYNGGTGKGLVSLYRKHKNEFILIDKFSGEDAGCELGK